MAQTRPPNYGFYDRRMFDEPPAARDRRSQELALAAAPAAGDAETVARVFLAENRELLGLESTGVFSLPLERRYESEAARLTHLVFRPQPAGIAVFGGEVLVHLDRDGNVVAVHSGAVWPAGAAASVAAALDASQAAAEALRLLEPGATAGIRTQTPETGPDRRTLLDAGLRQPVPARLVWFPLAREVRLAWELYLDIDPARWYSAVVDAVTGELLFSHNLYRDNAPRGKVFRAADVAHPNLGASSVESFTGWPASAGDCPASIYPAQYRSGALLNRCWVSGVETAGNNAVACLDADGNNQCDWKASDPLAHFDFAFLNSYVLNNDPAPDRLAAVTNLFYWSNVLHDWLYGLGFNEAAGNFQADNFGRGGFEGDAVQADAQDGSGLNNANFATPPDGAAPRMQMFLFTNNGSYLRRDAAFDGDVITHEYVHGLTLRLVGGPGNINVLPLWQSGALGEGWSDAYAASFTSDPVIGEYIGASAATGIRSVAYNNSPHTFGRFGTLNRRNVGPLNLIIDLPQVHRDGEIWATVLWDLRAALGKPLFEQVLTTALKLTPARPSMLDARNAIVQAAQSLNAGGAGQCGVWSVFAARGFGASAALNHVQAGLSRDTALSVYEAYDLPASCGGTPPQPGAPLFSEDAESGAGGWTATGLWHLTARRAAGGTRSWWYGQEASGNYETGARTAGALTSPAISVPAGARVILEWDQLFLGEGFGRNYPLGSPGNDPYLNHDSGWVLISRDGGSTWDTLTTLAHNSDSLAFDHHKVDISRYAGSSIRIRFLFDSLDPGFNRFEGWYVDNIRVSPLLTGAPALGVTPSSLGWSAVLGGAPPPSQTLSVANLGSGVMSWTASASSGGWLAVSPASGSGSASLTVTVQGAGLASGTYNGSITVTAPGAAGSPAAVPVILTVSGALAEWRFEDAGAGAGVQVADSSPNLRHGTTAGHGSAAIPGVSGNARMLNGFTDAVVVASSGALSPPSFTFRTWVKLLSYPASAGWGVVAANYGGNYQGWYLGIHSSGRVIFSVASLPASAPWLLSGAALALERWYLITTTYDGATRQGVIYINGALDAQAAFAGFSPQSALPFTLGRASWFNGYCLNAALDEARLLPTSQTAAQVLGDSQTFAAPPAPPANAGLAAEWRLDDTGSTLTDSSGNSRHGSFTGAAVTAGVRSGARAFNGVTDLARVPPSAAFHPSSFTARVWIKLLSYPQAAGWGVALSDYAGNYQGWYIGVHSSGRVIFSTASLPSTSPWVLSNRALALNRWYHVAATWEGAAGQSAIYVDGVLDVQMALPGFTPSPSTEVFLGRASWYDGYYLNAAIDDARVEAGARTAAQILSDFQSFPAQPPPPPQAAVAEWRMDDPATALTDSSGNGQSATAYGATTAPGIRNSAKRFNGVSDWAQAAASAALSPPSFTVRVWVKPAALPAGWAVLVANYDGQYRGWYLGLHSSGRVIFSVAGLPASSPWLVSGAALPVNVWSCITATYDGAVRAGVIYINGARDADAVFPGFTPQSTVPVTIGRASWYAGYHLDATIDEVRLLDMTQAPGEVAADYRSFP